MHGNGTWWAEHAWLGGERNAGGVLIGVKDGTFSSVTPGVPVPPPGATTLRGITMPGLVNAHSHAFHRALRGRTHDARGTFWSWRDTMYRAAEALDPDLYLRLARAVFAEMVLAGYTTVGEFHYLHHDPLGRPYSDPNQMGSALLGAASEAGIRITLIDACYLSGGFGETALEGVQRRFSDTDVSCWAERVASLKTGDGQRMAAAVHSVRAVPPGAIKHLAAYAAQSGWPLHAHVSEQRAEVDDCMAATGLSPFQLLETAGALDCDFTAVHATHAGPHDVVVLGDSRAHVCACPTTERDLGDGIGPFARMRDVGVQLCLGSDSHAVIDGFEEARALEMDSRLVSEQRVLFSSSELIRAATSAGLESLGWSAGGLAPGQPADFVSIRTDTPRTAGCDPELAASTIFGASAADVDTVVVGGDTIVDGGEHTRIENPAAAIAAAVDEVWAWHR
ncbi:MAG TPA: formimidoylglutamate deiminase [Acidimicrobiales bacterium]|nr:formimidoylglutamate deiminase [Acidimicrobiales bacterium]